MREALVKTRTRYINLMGALLRAQGYHLGGGSAEAFVRRLDQLGLPESVRAELEPLVQVLGPLNAQLEQLERELAQRANAEPEAQILMSMPSVGPLTSLCFLAVLDAATRFQNAHQVEAYLGLVLKEYSSGEKQQRGSITKVGGKRMRSLLGQLAISTMRLRKAEMEPLWKGGRHRAAARHQDCADCPCAASRRGPVGDVARWPGVQAEGGQSTTPLDRQGQRCKGDRPAVGQQLGGCLNRRETRRNQATTRGDRLLRSSTR